MSKLNNEIKKQTSGDFAAWIAEKLGNFEGSELIIHERVETTSRE